MGAVGGSSEAHHWQFMMGPSFTQHWLVLGLSVALGTAA